MASEKGTPFSQRKAFLGKGKSSPKTEKGPAGSRGGKGPPLGRVKWPVGQMENGRGGQILGKPPPERSVKKIPPPQRPELAHLKKAEGAGQIIGKPLKYLEFNVVVVHIPSPVPEWFVACRNKFTTNRLLEETNICRGELWHAAIRRMRLLYFVIHAGAVNAQLAIIFSCRK